MILLIDNYDSFVYNLARYVNELDFDCVVKRNDHITLDDISVLQPSHIIISPGPCTPNEAGISLNLIKHFASRIPILGVCLGHQAIAQAWGAKIVRAKHPMHGKSAAIFHHEQGLFQQLPNPLTVGRYHSLIVDQASCPDDLMITAYCEAGEVMAIQHKHYPLFGVQFHPESVLTQGGHQLLKNFLAFGGVNGINIYCRVD